nr:MAG TPA: hypothetical protein [Caudoviricetes sp.]
MPSFAYLKGDVQSPTREHLVCTIGLEGTRTYTSEGALVIPPGLHKFVGHCDLPVPAGTFTVVLRTGKVRLQAEVTFEEGKTYTLQEIFNGNSTGALIPNKGATTPNTETPTNKSPLTIVVEDGVISVRKKK